MHLGKAECCIPCWVNVTLTSDLVLKYSCQEDISYIFCTRNPKFGMWLHFWMEECHVPFFYHCDLDLVSRIIMSGAYLVLEVGITNLEYGCIFRC